MTQTSQFLINHGLPLMFAAVFVEQRGLPLPALPWLLAAGALSAAGQFNFPLGVAVTVFACLVADAFWFYLGRHRGNQILGLLCRISLEPDSCVRRTQNVFTRYGLRGLLVAKFLPGLSTVALSLHRRGFARVRPLLGGIDAWREQHYPMEPRPSDGAAPVATSPLAREGVVANVASIPLPGGNESHPAKGGNGKVSILLVATSLVWIAGCKPKAHVTPSPPMVEVFTVTQADVPLYHEWIGVLDGLVNAQIRAQVTGYLITQDYHEGDPIKKDDLLFQIDPRPFKAAFDQAQGLLAQAEARVFCFERLRSTGFQAPDSCCGRVAR